MASFGLSKDHVDFKVVMLGSEYSGKTSLVQRYIANEFHGNLYQNTIGASYTSKDFNINLRKVRMGIWDTAGAERYHAISKIYYRNCRAAVICFDPTDQDSFKKLRYWVTEVKKSSAKAKIYIVKTKMDLFEDGKQKSVVDQNDVNDLVQEFDAKMFETSAKTGENVKELYYDIAQDYVNDPTTSITFFGDYEAFKQDRLRSRLCCGF